MFLKTSKNFLSTTLVVTLYLKYMHRNSLTETPPNFFKNINKHTLKFFDPQKKRVFEFQMKEDDFNGFQSDLFHFCINPFRTRTIEYQEVPSCKMARAASKGTIFNQNQVLNLNSIVCSPVNDEKEV